MKLRIGFWLAAAMAVGGMTVRAEEAEGTNEVEGVEASVDLGVFSAYVWRGQVINDEAVAQPQLNLGWNGFSAHVWGNYDFTDTTSEDAPTFTEVDLTAAYTRKVGPAELTGSYVHYFFPHQKLETTTETMVGGEPMITTTREDLPSTGEVGFEARLPDLPVVPILTVARDVKEANGFSGTVGAEASVPLVAERISLDLNATLGCGDADYNRFYYGVDESAIDFWAAGAALTWTLCDGLSVAPGVQYSAIVDRKLREATAASGKDRDIVVGSLSATWEF